jgi:hypothetical protein
MSIRYTQANNINGTSVVTFQGKTSFVAIDNFDANSGNFIGLQFSNATGGYAQISSIGSKDIRTDTLEARDIKASTLFINTITSGNIFNKEIITSEEVDCTILTVKHLANVGSLTDIDVSILNVFGEFNVTGITTLSGSLLVNTLPIGLPNVVTVKSNTSISMLAPLISLTGEPDISLFAVTTTLTDTTLLSMISPAMTAVGDTFSITESISFAVIAPSITLNAGTGMLLEAPAITLDAANQMNLNSILVNIKAGNINLVASEEGIVIDGLNEVVITTEGVINLGALTMDLSATAITIDAENFNTSVNTLTMAADDINMSAVGSTNMTGNSLIISQEVSILLNAPNISLDGETVSISGNASIIASSPELTIGTPRPIEGNGVLGSLVGPVIGSLFFRIPNVVTIIDGVLNQTNFEVTILVEG